MELNQLTQAHGPLLVCHHTPSLVSTKNTGNSYWLRKIPITCRINLEYPPEPSRKEMSTVAGRVDVMGLK
jgi:hypothetical protein